MSDHPAKYSHLSDVRTFRDLSPTERALWLAREPLIAAYVARRTVILCEKTGDALGTGTLVDVQGTPMIATAAHVAEIMAERRESLVYAGLSPHDPHIHRFHELAKAYFAGEDADVAAIVLTPSARDLLTNAAWLDASHVGLGPMGVPETVIQVGSPLEIRKQARAGLTYPKVNSESGQVAVAAVTCLKECPLDAHAHDELLHERAKRWGAVNDYHVDWSERDAEGSNAARLQMPDPGGMSGGGVWDWRCPVEQVWTPEHLRLVAINWFFTPEANCIRAAPAALWLEVARTAAAGQLR